MSTAAPPTSSSDTAALAHAREAKFVVLLIHQAVYAHGIACNGQGNKRFFRAVNPVAHFVRRIGRGDISVQWRASRRNTLRLTYTGFSRYGSGRFEWEHALGEGWGNSVSGLRLYTWVFHGYGESLIDYNRKRTSLSVGLSLLDF